MTPKSPASGTFSFSGVERRSFKPTQVMPTVRRTLDSSFCRDSCIRDYIPFSDTVFPEGVIILFVRYFCPFVSTQDQSLINAPQTWRVNARAPFTCYVILSKLFRQGHMAAFIVLSVLLIYFPFIPPLPSDTIFCQYFYSE